MAQQKTGPDVTLANHGSIVLVTPMTKAAKTWIDANVSDEAQWFGKSLVVEPRYVWNLVKGMQDEGLTVK